MNRYSVKERCEIINNLDKKPIKEIAESIGRSYKAVCEFISRCGLSKSPNYSSEEIDLILHGGKNITGRSGNAIRIKRHRLTKSTL